ncbi:MAG: lysophospholipid acyltransferase family protein [Acidaminococcaceae bacterium]|nr:lysophospholipid acyltransferase family protein [Acidaminococcaceae bacterium]
MWYRFVQVFFHIIFKILFRFEIIGKENIPKNGPLIVASNHASLLDPPLVGTASTRKVCFMAKEELFVPVLGELYRSLGAFPVKRGASDRTAIKWALQLLKTGKVLGIFPEGTRSKTGKLGHAGSGTLGMAGKFRVPIIPTAIIGSNLKMQKSLWPKIKVVFGKPIYFPEDRAVDKELLQEMTDKMMQEIGQMLEIYR